MFKRYYILKKRAEFLKVRNCGFSVAKKNVVVQACLRAQGSHFSYPRFGYTATKKIGNSVIRNRCRRRLKNVSFLIFSNFLEEVSNIDWVFIARFNCDRCPYLDLYRQVEDAVADIRTRLLKV